MAADAQLGVGVPVVGRGSVCAMTPAPDEGEAAPKPHRAARIEDALHRTVEPRLRRRGRQVTIVPYTGYGRPDWVRAMCRVVLARPDPRGPQAAKVRGWRSFTTVPVREARVVIEAAGRTQEARPDRAGVVDCVVDLSEVTYCDSAAVRALFW